MNWMDEQGIRNRTVEEGYYMVKQYIELGTLITGDSRPLLLFVFIQSPIALLVNSVIAIVILMLLNYDFQGGIPST